MLCNQTLPDFQLVRCYYDLDTFQVALYLNLFGPCLFIAWTIFVMVNTRCKIDGIGISMLCATTVQQAALLTMSIIYLKQSLLNRPLLMQNYHIILFSITLFIVILKQVYFIMSLKKVRIWLESKTPLELKLKLKTYNVLRWF